jgi:hypothetical protein
MFPACRQASPGGVLFRAIEPLEGVKTMARLRGIPEASGASRINGGPGRMCQALGITRELQNGVDVTRKGSTLHVVDDGYHVSRVVATPRIGIQKSGGSSIAISDHHRSSSCRCQDTTNPSHLKCNDWLRRDSGSFRCRSEETTSTKRGQAFLEPIEHQLDVFSAAEFSRNLKGT